MNTIHHQSDCIKKLFKKGGCVCVCVCVSHATAFRCVCERECYQFAAFDGVLCAFLEELNCCLPHRYYYVNSFNRECFVHFTTLAVSFAFRHDTHLNGMLL